MSVIAADVSAMTDETAIDSQRVADCLEALCQHGCKAVWALIEAMEAGETLPETTGLTTAERVLVLEELKSVMAVYGECELR